ncbi:MAG: hypothetical protein M3Z03_17530, partial [Actinomycetota bacterium]|nr:hypothetical protein [Actinomycetota bacterium]
VLWHVVDAEHLHAETSELGGHGAPEAAQPRDEHLLAGCRRREVGPSHHEAGKIGVSLVSQ